LWSAIPLLESPLYLWPAFVGHDRGELESHFSYGCDRHYSETWGAVDRIFRLRGDYEKQTDVVFTKKIDGVGWESKRGCFSSLL
jgi:hypothetical protein